MSSPISILDLGDPPPTKLTSPLRGELNGPSLLCRLVYGLLAGSWADTHGRKMLMLLSVLGQLLATLSYALNYLLLRQLPWQFLYLELVNDLCGHYVSYYLAIYSYIARIATQDSRLDRCV